MILTILTPTYNRREYLPRLYESLCAQTNQDFQWLVIDDGSTDDTEEWFASLSQTKFVKEYHKKGNGGKHTALNFSHSFIMGEIVFITDSDDWLTEDAVDTILNDWKRYRENSSICGITYLRGETPKKPLKGITFPQDGEISDNITRKVNTKVTCDSAEIIRTAVLKEFSFPEHKGELFLGESYLWNQAGYNYKTVFRNQVIYITEYLEEGLTRSGRKLRIQCPLGGMDNSKTYFDRRVCLKQRIKNTWLYVCYGKFADWRFGRIVRESGQTVMTCCNYLFGLMLYWYWKRKYGR